MLDKQPTKLCTVTIQRAVASMAIMLENMAIKDKLDGLVTGGMESGLNYPKKKWIRFTVTNSIFEKLQN